jgi:hypothetical protein
VTVPVKTEPHPFLDAMMPEEAVGLEEIDQVLKTWSDQRHAFAARQAEIEATRLLFVRQAAEIADYVIRPAMEAALARLAWDGGGGRIEERPSDDTHSLRLILWMSLEGDIAGAPRQDRNPYLQLDIDVATRRIDVWEGDRWEKQGSSRSTSPWRLSEITAQSVTHRVIDILQRAASHDVGGLKGRSRRSTP